MRLGVELFRAVAPAKRIVVERNLPGPGTCRLLGKNLFQLVRDSWVLDQDALLAIEPRRSRIEVITADEYESRVDGQRFRVQARTG